MDFPNTFYHVLSRGNERREIFRDEKDYLNYLDILRKMAERFKIEVHAYVLMPNHYHLLIRTKQGNLSKSIQWLGVSYSVWFNRRHKRSGHLFQGRFKSFVIEDNNYFTAMCMYLHGNPFRAGIVEDLSEYRWSSYMIYAYKKYQKIWLKTDMILSMYGGSHRKFRRAQKSYLGQEAGLLENLRCGMYLGTKEYAELCLKKLKGEVHPEKPQVKLLLRSKAIKGVALEILDNLGERDPDLVLGSRKRKSCLNRDIAMYILSHLGRFTNKEIGEVFGVGYTAVTEAIKRSSLYLGKDKRLSKKVYGLIIDN